MTEYQYHPIANAFPLIEGEAFDKFAADIKARGLQENIILFEDKILDGRNRYRACLTHGVEPKFKDYQGDDPIGFVISGNIHRRHLDESQRAMAAAKLATMRPGGDRPSVNDANFDCANLRIGISQPEIAEKMNVSRRLVQSAKAVQENGVPELIAAVEKGEMKVSAAAKIATRSKAEQREVMEDRAASKHANTGLTEKIKKILSDGKWHVLEEIAQRTDVEPSIDGESSIQKALKRIKDSKDIVLTTDKKHVLKRGHVTRRYRVAFKKVVSGAISIGELTEKLRPIIEGLKQQGKCNAATISPPYIQRQAYTLEKLLDEWTSRLASKQAHDAKPSSNSAEETTTHAV